MEGQIECIALWDTVFHCFVVYCILLYHLNTCYILCIMILVPSWLKNRTHPNLRKCHLNVETKHVFLQNRSCWMYHLQWK